LETNIGPADLPPTGRSNPQTRGTVAQAHGGRVRYSGL